MSSIVPRCAAVVAGAAMLAACSNSTAGQPTGDGSAASSEAPTESSSSSAPTSSSGASPEFSNTALCELLTADESAQLGGEPTGEPGYSTANGNPLCQWSDATSLVVTFAKNGQSKDVKIGPNVTSTATTIAGLTAVQLHEVDVVETCQLVVDITDRSAMSLLAGLHDKGKGKYETCDVATRLATIVIPKVKQR